MTFVKPSHIYYFDIGEGRWNGQFSFKITDLPEFWRAELPHIDRLLALFLHGMEALPGQAQMHGEILGDPTDGPDGVARVEVSVIRFGFEIYRLRGHYALQPDGQSVDIHIIERFGPKGSPMVRHKRAEATIEPGGRRAVYRMPILGIPFEGVYDIDKEGTTLDAHYQSPWAYSREVMYRKSPEAPSDPKARLRWDALLCIARNIETLARKYDNADDPRAPFAHVYGYMLRDLAYRFQETPFEDLDWVVTLARAFAHQYLVAMDEYENHRTSGPWKIVLDAITTRNWTVVDELILSMFAHLAHDLPLALKQIGLTNLDGKSHIHDFDRVNALLVTAIDPLQNRLANRYNPIVKLIDTLMGQRDEVISAQLIDLARTRAWYDAQRLHEQASVDAFVHDVEEQTHRFIQELGGKNSVQRLGHQILRNGIRGLRQHERHPTGELNHEDASQTPASLPTGDSSVASAMYALRTEIGVKKGRTNLKKFYDTLRKRSRDLLLLPTDWNALAPLFRASSWTDHLRSIMREEPDLRYTLAAMLPELQLNGSLKTALDILKIGDLEHEAILAMRSQLIRVLDRGFDAAQAGLETAAQKLDAIHFPASAILSVMDDPRGGYDPETDTFHAAVAAYFPVDFEDVRWIVLPNHWADVIHQVVETSYLKPLDENGQGILREVVNVLHPWVENHPLHLVNDLDVRLTDEPGFRRVDYSLIKSHCDTFSTDEGYLSARSLGPNRTLVLIEKRIQIRGNPLLYAMLRFNPDGLAMILNFWINDASRQGRHLDSPS